MLSADTSWDDKMKNQTGIISANEINLQGNEVYVDVGNINGDQLKSLKIQGSNGNNFKGSMYLNASGYYYNPSSFKVFDKYTNTNNNFKVYKYVGIGSDLDWWHFAKGWNENKEGFRDTASEYRLTNDIDFNGNQGKGEEGRDWQNYANYCIDGYGCTNMIVGLNRDSAFNKTFDGQGFALKNINIDTTNLEYIPEYIGIFGYAERANFRNINVDYMDGVINATGGVHAGGFVGFAKDSYFNKISLQGIDNMKTSTGNTGGFAGGIYGGEFKNISLSEIKNIYNDSSYYLSAVGGFAGGVDDAKFENISLNKMGDMSAVGARGGFIGRFVGNARGSTFKNISLINMGDIIVQQKYYGYSIGGFIGQVIDGAKFENISLNGMGDITFSNSSLTMSAETSIGSFSGVVINDSEFYNISLNNIGDIKLSGVFNQSINAGGFVGWVMAFDGSSVVFNNISLNNIGNINTDSPWGNLGGFAGEISGNITFKNIYMYFNEGVTIEGTTDNGKFVGDMGGDSQIKFDNIHIYHHENDLTNATADQDYWGDTADKIQIHTYNNSNKDEVYKDFQDKANTISKPMLPIVPPPSKPSEDMNIPDVEDIKNETATLGENDLISKDIWDYIINDIDKVHYNIDIRLLAKLLNEYSDISNKTEDEQVKFITTYLGVKENDARALLQSLSFLNAYKNHDISKANFESETVKEDFANSFDNAETKFTNFNNKKNKLYDELKVLNENIVSKGFNIEHLLDENQEELAKAIKAYNDYVVLIEKGLANENDPLFVSIKNTIIKLNTEAKNLYAQLLNYKDQLQDFKDNNKFEKVIIAGDFKTIPLLIAPDVNRPIDGGGEIEIPDKPIDP
ncbi:hypothetical protein, partial [Campylobacter sp. CNRCH_2014_0184h]|uniref:hypothetical protein n=1 Tax=Campylobacter sp. CNRCH_2014_0184h TaxID=2911602 RepID=UPI0021E69310